MKKKQRQVNWGYWFWMGVAVIGAVILFSSLMNLPGQAIVIP